MKSPGLDGHKLNSEDPTAFIQVRLRDIIRKDKQKLYIHMYIRVNNINGKRMLFDQSTTFNVTSFQSKIKHLYITETNDGRCI